MAAVLSRFRKEKKNNFESFITSNMIFCGFRRDSMFEKVIKMYFSMNSTQKFDLNLWMSHSTLSLTVKFQAGFVEPMTT